MKQTTKEIAAEISDRINRIRHDQLALYVGHVRRDPLNPDSEPYSYEAASELPLAELERLFEADDYGDAWEIMDREDAEGFEGNDGAIRALTDLLAWIEGS